MKKIILSISMLGGVMLSYAQVGVGTTTPQASLHVKETRDASNLNNTTSKDGIIPPTLTKSELSKKAASTYASAQNGAIVFVSEVTTATAPSDPSLTQVADINAIGYYYFDSSNSKWVKLTPSVPTQDLRYVGTNNHVTQDAGFGGNGSSAGTGSDNIAIGKGALNAITSSAESVAVGSGALNKLTTGIYNNAIGKNALNNITTQSSNTAFGYEALQALTTSFNGMNSALGYRTGMQLKTGSKNTFLGNNTATFLNATATHDSNTFVGTEVTTANNADPGVNVIYLENTALGFLALNNIPAAVTNINYSTFLGKGTTLTSSTSGTITNATAIGSSAQVGASNSIVLGRANATGTLDNVGIGVTSPLNALHVKSASNPVKLEGLAADATAANLVVVDTNGILKTLAKSTFATAGSGDTTNDAWVNNATNTRVELGTKADGTTARTAGTDIVMTDSGRIGVGTGSTAPDAGLHIIGDNDGYKDDIRLESYSGGATTPGANFRFYGARGTAAAPVITAVGDILGQFNFYNHTGGTNGYAGSPVVRLYSSYRGPGQGDLVMNGMLVFVEQQEAISALNTTISQISQSQITLTGTRSGAFNITLAAGASGQRLVIVNTLPNTATIVSANNITIPSGSAKELVYSTTGSRWYSF